MGYLDTSDPRYHRPRQPSLSATVREAMASHGDTAPEAYRLFRSWVAADLPSVPGMDTVLRLAVRLNTRDVNGAAAAEYLYRWRLALQSRVFGVPHTLGL